MMQFRPLGLNELDTYQEKVGSALTPEEFTDKERYLHLLETRKLFKSWVMYDDITPEIWVGWCAVAEPVTVSKDTVHLYGGVIFEPFRGKGYSKLLYHHRFNLFKERDISVSVRPENIRSMNIALSHGFLPFSYQEGFINMIKKAL